MTETVFYKLTRHDAGDPDEGAKYPAPIVAERPTVRELVILAALDIGGQRKRRTPLVAMDVSALSTDATPENLPIIVQHDGFTWRIDFADEAQRTHDEHLTISVGRDTAKEARDALAWFQLGQSEPVTIDVEEGCLAVHLDDGILSIGVEGTEDATVWYKPHGEEGYEFGAVIPAGFGLNEEEQVEFYEIIDGLMGNLAGFHYLAGGAAVRAIVAEGRP